MWKQFWHSIHCGFKKFSFENKNIGVYENSTCDFVVARTLFNNIMNIANIFSVSVEKIVEYLNDKIIVVTQNTRFVFKLINK